MKAPFSNVLIEKKIFAPRWLFNPNFFIDPSKQTNCKNYYN